MRAKTYRSTNGFTAPQSLSTFGIKITNGKATKHLGLEEFNFCTIVRKYKFEGKNLAFVPCFSINRGELHIDQLDLFYRDATGITLHYATLYGVSQIQVTDVNPIRKELIQAGLPDFVETSQAFQANYGVLFNPALKIWHKCFNSNTIIASGTNDRFIVNTFYDKIVHHNPQKQVNWSNLQRARLLYPRSN